MSKCAKKKKPATKRRRKNAGPNSFRKTKKLLNRKIGGKKMRSSKRMKYVTRAGTAGSHASRVLVKHFRETNPVPKKAKTGRWYKGPRGVKVRVRRVKGKFVVDLKK